MDDARTHACTSLAAGCPPDRDMSEAQDRALSSCKSNPSIDAKKGWPNGDGLRE